MQTIDRLLSQYGIFPTAVTREDKARLAEWLISAKANPPADHLSCEARLNTELTILRRCLEERADALIHLIKQATNAIEPLLTQYADGQLSFSDRTPAKVLTDGHVNMLTSLEETMDNASHLTADSIDVIPSDSLLQPENSTELILRHLALRESGENEALCRRFAAFSREVPDLYERAVQLNRQLINATHDLYVIIRSAAKGTSDAITAANRGQIPQNRYFQSLQAALISLHDAEQHARQIRKEVNHVQISDVL